MKLAELFSEAEYHPTNAEDEMAAASATSSQIDTVTRSRDTASTDGVSSVKKSRQVIKRKRNPSVKKAKFLRPDGEEEQQ